MYLTTTTNVLFALNSLVVPTVSKLPVTLEQPLRLVENVSSQINENFNLIKTKHTTSTVNNINFNIDSEVAARQTTEAEKIIGEMREWSSYENNWDGEHSLAPSATSLKEAVAFVRLINNENNNLPQPAILASGHISLYWNEPGLFADVEFLGNERIAYYIKKNNDKHKGVITFDSQKVPTVFSALIGV